MTVFEITQQNISLMTTDQLESLREQFFDEEEHICRTRAGAVAYNAAIALIEQQLEV